MVRIDELIADFGQKQFDQAFCDACKKSQIFSLGECVACQISKQREEHHRAMFASMRANALKVHGVHEVSFDYWRGDNKKMAFAQKFKNYADSINPQSPNILLVGRAGTGKTLLVNMLANRVFDRLYRGVSPVYLEKTASITERVKATWGRNAESSDEILNELAKYNLLILDDLGDGDAVNQNDTARFGQIIDMRHKKAPTVITTNLTPMQVKEFLGVRAWDRFSSNMVIAECSWDSYRQQTAKQEIW